MVRSRSGCPSLLLLPLMLATDTTRRAFVHEENRGCANFEELKYVETQVETLQECLDMCAARRECAESFSSRGNARPMSCLLFSDPGCSLEFSSDWDLHKKHEQEETATVDSGEPERRCYLARKSRDYVTGLTNACCEACKSEVPRGKDPTLLSECSAAQDQHAFRHLQLDPEGRSRWHGERSTE